MFLKKHGKQTYGRKQSATDTFKTTSKSVIQKTAEETGDLIGNKIKSQNFQKKSQQIN